MWNRITGMVNAIRSRLLASYLLLLVVTMIGMVMTLFVATSNQPAPPAPIYSRIAPMLRSMDNNPLLQIPQNTQPGADNNTPSDRFPLLGQAAEDRRESRLSRIASRISDFAASSGMRIVEVQVDSQTNRTLWLTALYDTDGTLTEDNDLRAQIDDYQPDVRIDPGFRFANQMMFGDFTEDGQEWLFGAVQLTAPDGDTWILMAEERPTQSLQSALSDFGSSLAGPLLQAGLIGLVIAIMMSYIISRTIAQPLQAASAAATAVAEGDLSQHVPITGPNEVRAVARAFNRMSAEVRATQQSQRDFMANVSHDLKTPLTSIQGYSQAIVDGAAKDPKHAAEIIYDEASRLNRMVVELTDLARMQVGQLSMKTDHIDVGQIAAMVARKLEVVAENKGVTLENHASTMPSVTGDGDRLVQVMTNLLSNAIKYTRAGGRVRIQTRALTNGVEVIVSDTGVGIPKDDLPRIFERFYQVDKSRGPTRGTGLGLAITNEIVQAHGGRITVDSTQGRGTTFTVWLPRAESMAQAGD